MIVTLDDGSKYMIDPKVARFLIVNVLPECLKMKAKYYVIKYLRLWVDCPDPNRNPSRYSFLIGYEESIHDIDCKILCAYGSVTPLDE